MSSSENYYYYDSESAAWKPCKLEELEFFNNPELYVCREEVPGKLTPPVTYGTLKKQLSEVSEQKNECEDSEQSEPVVFGGMMLEKPLLGDEDAFPDEENETYFSHNVNFSRSADMLLPKRVSLNLFVKKWKSVLPSMAIPVIMAVVGIIFIAIAGESRNPAWGEMGFGVIMLLAGLIAASIVGKQFREVYFIRRCHDLGFSCTSYLLGLGFALPVTVGIIIVTLVPDGDEWASIASLASLLPFIIQTLRIYFQEGNMQPNEWGAPGLSSEGAISKEEALAVLKEMRIEANAEAIEKHLDIVTLQLWLAISGDGCKDQANKYLRKATVDGNVACVKRLLSLPEIDVNIADKNGDTPLKLASKYGHLECAALLRAAGAKG